MGSGQGWSSAQWGGYQAHKVIGKTQSQIFSTTSLKPVYDPAKIEFRESRDSADNPNSTPIILAADVTGSMGMISEKLMREGLNKLSTEIYKRKPISDPHIMGMAIGDGFTDQAPLQVTQFEADIRIAEQLSDLWLEGRGGGNGGESYGFAHVFAAMKTRADAFEKRGKKGYLFTVGDEPIHNNMPRAQIERFLGISVEADMTAEQAIRMAQRNYEVFHIVLVNEGQCRGGKDQVLASWNKVLPERVIQLEDVDALAETIVSLIQVTEGQHAADVAASWSGSTSVVVANAIRGVSKSRAVATQDAGIRRL
jgi:hypothetical protein